MRVALAFQGEAIDFEVAEDRFVGDWHGPDGVVGEGVGRLVREAIEAPRQFPALRLAVVPGDRVVIPMDPDVPEPAPILAALCEVLQSAGVEPADILVLAPAPMPGLALPEGVGFASHAPEDREQIAYLSTSSAGRRVYLNRMLTDADLVVPVGLLGPDPVLGHRGPWGVIYPGLGDAEAARAFRALATGEPPARGEERPALAESGEVSWLLGSQFHVGIVPGAAGVAGVVAGHEAAVRAEGIAAVDSAWTFRAEDRADLVVAGIGAPGRPTTLDDLARGLASASKVVRRGGKVVALSRADGSIGPAMGRLIAADDPRSGPSALRGAEGEPDYPAARLLAGALAWADIYLASALPESEVDDLAMVPLARPEEARRLVAASPSTLFLDQADRTFAEVADEDD